MARTFFPLKMPPFAATPTLSSVGIGSSDATTRLYRTGAIGTDVGPANAT